MASSNGRKPKPKYEPSAAQQALLAKQKITGGRFEPHNPQSPIQYKHRTGAETPGVTAAITEALGKVRKSGAWTEFPKEPVVEPVHITPEIAGDWLARNTSNRKLRDARVNMIARDIMLGNWTPLTGDTIKFSPKGELLDGQHRLLACIVANTPIDSYVAFGVPKEAFRTFDTGLKRRVTDALFVAGEQETRILGATLNALYRWLVGSTFSYGSSPTNSELLAVLDSAPTVRESAKVAAQVRRRLPGALWGIVGACHYLFNERHPEAAEYFFEKLEHGSGLAEDDPIYVLRERLVRRMPSSGLGFRAAQEQGVLFVKTWNAYRAGERWTGPRSLRFREGEPVPEIA